MLSRKKLKQHFDKRWKKIIPISKGIARQPDSDKVHDLRLHGKKLKSVNELLRSAVKRPKAFSLSPVKPLFRDAGVVRTAEMHLKIFADLGLDDPVLVNEQRAQITWGYVVLGMKRKEYQHSIRAARKHFDRNIRPVKTKDVKRYFDSTIDRLTLGFLWPIEVDQLHENRKKIKNLIYVYNMLPRKIQQKILLNKDYLDKLQDLIGQWHDLAVTSALLAEKAQQQPDKIEAIRQKEREKLNEVKKEVELFERRVYAPSLAKQAS